MIKIFLRMEGAVVLGCSIAAYAYLQFSWLLFLILLLVPDLSALGYLKNNQAGSILYNIFHTYILPAAMLIAGFAVHSNIVVIVGLIWVAHIGMDRMIGYGLKYPSRFQDTHLDHI